MSVSIEDFKRRIHHPCFSEAMHSKVGRIHLPVARLCNIHCLYCERRIGEFYHSLRPGVAARVIRPSKVRDYIRRALAECPSIAVIAVAGPGEPLYNKETFESLRIARKYFPNKKLCVCTNGLLLPDKVKELWKLGVEFLTVTINAVDPQTGARIYSFANHRGKLHRGVKAAELLAKNQFAGIAMAVRAGMEVKVNSVYIPGMNDADLPAIARAAASLGVRMMNLMPLIPSGRLAGRKAPTCAQLKKMRVRCEKVIPQFRLCKQCRADACGIPGE